jgi:hypothetical protein
MCPTELLQGTSKWNEDKRVNSEVMNMKMLKVLEKRSEFKL